MENCRLILSRDTAQHRAVERGDARRILENHAGFKETELTENRRQKAGVHENIVANLHGGNLKGLHKLGCPWDAVRYAPDAIVTEALIRKSWRERRPAFRPYNDSTDAFL
jgi:hypothetical protein